jgi:LytS/YehU family sensor histidine kinase
MSGVTHYPGRAAVFWLLLLFPILGGAQSVFAPGLHFFGGQPDFVLTLALVAALLTDAAVGSLLGLFAGLVSASLVGQAVGTFLVSRTIAGFIAGSFTERLYGKNWGVMLLGVFVGSVVADLLNGLATPRISLLHWLQSALVGGTMNALLAIPLSLILQRCGWGKRER